MTVDQNYLLSDQYKDGSNLNARLELHRRFSTNKYGWHPWALDQLSIPPLPVNPTILEIGTGPGWLWRTNAARIPADWQITLSDFSPGMVAEARQGTKDIPHLLNFETFDIQSIPFAANHFDVVIANHMLYHVPDLEKAFSEIQRVLKPAGRFYAATNGTDHLRELYDLEATLRPREVMWQGFAKIDSFTLENGAALLAHYFHSVERRLYPDALKVTEVDPLVAYVLSGIGKHILSDAEVMMFRQVVAQRIVEQGAFHITKSQGTFVAVKG